MNTPRRPLVPAVPGPNSGSLAQRQQPPVNRALSRQDEEPSTGLASMSPATYQAPWKTPHLTEAIASVMAKIGTIAKRGHNKFHNYDYARMDDLLERLTPLMGEAGITVYQNEVDVKMIETRVAVVYEFIVAHKSGEERAPVRRTGMSMARDSKGNFDDKALNKAHTQARKYFYLGLFNVPAGDFDDSDDGPYEANQRKEPVPGPGVVQPQQAQAPAPEVEETVPHKLAVPPGTTADQWANRFIKSIGSATTREEVLAWEANNDAFLQRISDGYPTIYEMIGAAMERRLSDLTQPAPSDMMPDPKADSMAAMNWIAAQLQQFQEYAAGEAFWNQTVAPRQPDFEPLDWENLIAEWQRFETKFPQEDPPATA